MKMYNFTGQRKIYFSISTLILVACIVCSFVFGIRLDIQFKGGSIITYNYQGSIDQSAFKADVESILGEKVNIQSTKNAITDADNLVVTLAAAKGLSSEKQLELQKTIGEKYAENKIETLSLSVVDPVIGKEFLVKCIVAILFASLLMIVYIGFRFKAIGGFSAGTMAVIALLHDIMVVFATFVILRIPLNDSFIAVVLTILGYSLNDTIVIYDRVRENKNLYGNHYTTGELVNLSITQSLSRSIATTVTTMMSMVVVCVLAYIYNVNSILTFAFPMIIGMISGVYSSICIAGPLWVMWQERKN
ncbi:MAG: protein translocase subunit SecF [Oscillospiraceae bacterium]